MFSLRGKLRVGTYLASSLMSFLAACSSGTEQATTGADTARSGDTARMANVAPGSDPGFQGVQRVVGATGCPETRVEPCQVTVSIEIVGRTTDMGPTNSPRGERSVAIIKNLGNYPTIRYGFKPSSQAYYFLKLKGNALRQGRWEIDELMKDVGNTNAAYKSGNIRECVKEYPHEKTEIDFKPCPHPLTPTAARQMSMIGSGLESATAFLRAALQRDTAQALEMPLWITCNSGCCSL